MNTSELYDSCAALLSALIAAESVSGNEGAVAETLANAFRSLGYDHVHVDGYGNVIGCIRGNRPGPKVLLDGHIDTVPVENRDVWTQPPFGGVRQGDRIYGRGASDMKGAVAAMTCGAARYRDLRQRDFPGEIYVAGVVYEELFEGIAARMVSQYVSPDYVVIGEASELNLKIGQRGRGEIVLETYGIPAHSANPEKGVNAVKMMMRLLQALEQYTPHQQPGLGKGIMELTDIISSPYPGASVVPEKCMATMDRRLLVGETPASVLTPIREILDALACQDPAFRGRVYLREATMPCYTGEVIQGTRFFPAWKFDRTEPFVQNSYSALVAAGLNPEITVYSFCTNGSHYAGEAGIRTIGFGPSKENLAHTVDEYIEVDQLNKAVDGYMAILEALLERTGL